MSHDPDEVAVLMDILGTCKKCKHHCIGRLVAYYSGEVLIRCSHCKRAGEGDFIADDTTFNDPNKFAPFIHDEDGGESYSYKFCCKCDQDC